MLVADGGFGLLNGVTKTMFFYTRFRWNKYLEYL